MTSQNIFTSYPDTNNFEFTAHQLTCFSSPCHMSCLTMTDVSLSLMGLTLVISGDPLARWISNLLSHSRHCYFSLTVTSANLSSALISSLLKALIPSETTFPHTPHLQCSRLPPTIQPCVMNHQSPSRQLPNQESCSRPDEHTTLMKMFWYPVLNASLDSYIWLFFWSYN